MPHPSKRVPSYRFHKPSGQAVVTLAGKDHYLGKHNSPESRSRYDQLIGEWLSNNRQLPQPDVEDKSATPAVTINELILAFWHHGEKHYRHPDGSPTGELENFRDAPRPLRRLYGCTQTAQFGPLALRVVRDAMIQVGLCRTTINARVNRIRRVFRWAASIELIPIHVVQALETVSGLQRGRCDARESDGVKPVRWSDVEATMPFMSKPVAAMIQLMRSSNCRAEDAVSIRGCDLQMGGDIWTYRPARHKNQWRGHERIIHLGSRATGDSAFSPN